MDPWKVHYPCIRSIGPGHNKEEVLRAVVPAVTTGTGTRVGFVIDADRSLQRSWSDIKAELLEAGVDTPDRIPRDGFVGDSREFETRVGVWIMPDNTDSGAIESFLRSLVPGSDPLWQHAHTATIAALDLGASFRLTDKWKAVLRAWLAWQRNPGLTYGVAIREKYFMARSGAADAFIAWFRRLYEADEPAAARASADGAGADGTR